MNKSENNVQGFICEIFSTFSQSFKLNLNNLFLTIPKSVIVSLFQTDNFIVSLIMPHKQISLCFTKIIIHNIKNRQCKANIHKEFHLRRKKIEQNLTNITKKISKIYIHKNNPFVFKTKFHLHTSNYQVHVFGRFKSRSSQFFFVQPK